MLLVDDIYILLPTFAPSQTSLECSAYCSTIGRILVVTIRWARLKFESISAGMHQLVAIPRLSIYSWLRMVAIVYSPCSVRVMDCSSFSNSSVSVKLRCARTVGRAILNKICDQVMYPAPYLDDQRWWCYQHADQRVPRWKDCMSERRQFLGLADKGL
jgi:hypothetical protein